MTNERDKADKYKKKIDNLLEDTLFDNTSKNIIKKLIADNLYIYNLLDPKNIQIVKRFDSDDEIINIAIGNTYYNFILYYDTFIHHNSNIDEYNIDNLIERATQIKGTSSQIDLSLIPSSLLFAQIIFCFVILKKLNINIDMKDFQPNIFTKAILNIVKKNILSTE